MKKLVILIIFISLGLGLSGLDINFNEIENNNKRYDINENDVKIRSSKDSDKSEIIVTSEGFLLINDNKVRLTKQEQKIVLEYYKQMKLIKKRAYEIAKDGGKIGLQGAGIGLKAILKLPLLLKSSELYEEAIEKEAEKLEEKAEKLEEKAEKLDAIADNLEVYEKELAISIEELGQIKWFSEKRKEIKEM